MANFEETLERIKKSTGARTQVDLANILGIRQSSISDAKKRNSIPADWFLKLFRSHGLNPDWLSEGVEPVYLKCAPGAEPPPGLEISSPGQQARSRTAKVSSIAKSDNPEEPWTIEAVGEIAIPEAFNRPNLTVIRVESANMEPLIKKGAYVGLDTEQARPLSGEVYGVWMSIEGLTLKRLYLDAENARFILRNENRNHPDQTLTAEKPEQHIVGRVVWVLQEM